MIFWGTVRENDFYEEDEELVGLEVERWERFFESLDAHKPGPRARFEIFSKFPILAVTKTHTD
jgi:hypothetical protein